MMHKRLSVFTLAALFSVGAYAGGQASFSELDQDEDGVISQQEAKGSQLEQNFQQADADGDKNVSQAEFALFEEQQQLKQQGQQQGGGQQGGGAQ